MQGYSQERLISVKNDHSLKTAFEMSKERMVGIFMFSKSVAACKNVKVYLERLAELNATSSFFIIDIEEYEGNAAVRSSQVPMVDFYYAGNKIESCNGLNYLELENAIKSGQQYVITVMNSKNNAQQKPTMAVPPMPAQAPAQQVPAQPVPTQYVPYQVPLPQYQPVHVVPQYSEPIAQKQDAYFNSTPTLSQMQQMFQIFQMMQQMGVLNTDVKVNMTKNDDEILLPDGRRVVQLANGKYGVIKKAN